MLAILYKQQEKLSISNRDPLVRKNGVMILFFQVVNINNNHWVLFTDIRQGIGQPQDVCEMTEFVIFPLLLGACIEFVTNIHLHQTDSEPHLEMRLSFLC